MVQNDLKRNGYSKSLQKKSRRYFVYVYMFPYQLKDCFCVVRWSFLTLCSSITCQCLFIETQLCRRCNLL